MVTSQSFQIAGISSALVSTSPTSDMPRTHESPGDPVTSKLIVAICPEPLTPVTPRRSKSTRIVSASTKAQDSIGTSVQPMRPQWTAVTFTTPGSNERSNCPESRSATLWTSIVTSNAPDTTSGALTHTCVFSAIISIMSASSELTPPSAFTSARSRSGATLPTAICSASSESAVVILPSAFTSPAMLYSADIGALSDASIISAQ